MLNRRTSAIAIPILLAALLAAVEAAGQQGGPSDAAPDAAACVGGGAIVGGERQPPTPAEVKARETSPACRGQEGAAPTVDSSRQAGRELDKIYRKLMRIDGSQGDGGQAPGAAGQ
jgi:hypothetical protein